MLQPSIRLVCLNTRFVGLVSLCESAMVHCRGDNVQPFIWTCVSPNFDSLLLAVTEHRDKSAIHLVHKCDHGVRQVHLCPRNRGSQQRRDCGHGISYVPVEEAHHSRISSDEPCQQSDSAQSYSSISHRGQPSDFQPGYKVQDEIISDHPASCVLEMDHPLQVGPGHSHQCVPLGYERMHVCSCTLIFVRDMASHHICIMQGSSDPEKVFDRTPNLENTQIINYRVDPQEKWCVLVGIAPGAPERYVKPSLHPCQQYKLIC